MISIKGIIDKVARHKLAVIAVAGAAAATGAVEITLADSGYSDGVYRGADGGGTCSELGVAEDHEKGDGFAGRSALMSSIWNVNLDF